MDGPSQGPDFADVRAEKRATAQVHATLALAVATALAGPNVRAEWNGVAR